MKNIIFYIPQGYRKRKLLAPISIIIIVVKLQKLKK